MKISLLSHSIPKRGRSAILQRLLAALCLIAVAGVPTLLAQRSTQKKDPGPRALGLLEVSTNGRARLVPIAIRIDGKFYDASLYRATPRPMALMPDTVYEAERGGESIGLFTVTNAQPVKDVWIGVGQWRLNQAPAPEVKSAGKAGSPADTKGSSSSNAEDDNDRPKLRRPGEPAASNSDGAGTSTASGAPTTGAKEDDDERPTLRKPGGQSSSAGTAAPPETKPTLQSKTTPPAQPKTAATPAPPPRDDSDRPTLRRGPPTDKRAEDEVAPTTVEKPGVTGAASARRTAQTVGVKPQAGVPLQVFTAISDAGGPEPASFMMQLTPDERRNLEGKVSAIAYAAVQKWATAHPTAKPAAASLLQLTAFQVFNLSNANEPIAVLCASLPATAGPQRAGNFQYFVTLVTRTDMYGQLRLVLTRVTDSTHLDSYSRMELIDAVDADGSKMGQLLFRQVSDNDFKFAIYRVGLDRLWPLFESAGRNF